MAVTLTAQPRSESGKGVARKLRRAGLVPGVVYGRGEETHLVSVPLYDLERLLSTISVENTIIELKVEGAAPAQALIREVQYHSTRPGVLHIDFFHVHAGEKVHVGVPVRLHGTPIGVRDFGAVLDQVLYDLEVESLPADIPEAVDIDVENLGIGESVHVREITLPNARILNDPDVVICTLTPPTVAALPVGSETEDGVGGDVEPEVIRNRKADAEDVPFQHGSAQPE